jgi:hemoglobin
MTKTRTFPTIALAWLLLAACASQETKPGFHTSGSREADQRAEQRISQVQQIRGEGEGGEDAGQDERRSLFERLGGAKGIERIVDDFVDRVIADPRTNWERKGIERGGVLGIGAKSAEWRTSADNVARLKHHMAQFIGVATGGPAKYEGREMRQLHRGMRITNAEFDASVGAMKATLDVLRVADEEQKELLAILESARPQIAEER